MAFGPLGPASESNETRAPSLSVRKPSELMPEWWTKRSAPWSSGVMNPKPLSSLNHFTVPVAIWPLHCAFAEPHARPGSGNVPVSSPSGTLDTLAADDLVGLVGGDRVAARPAADRVALPVARGDGVVAGSRLDE